MKQTKQLIITKKQGLFFALSCITIIVSIYARILSSEVQAGTTHAAPPVEPLYAVKHSLKPTTLEGISNEQIDDHWKLYEGYVKEVNTLHEELMQLRKTKKGDSLLYSDRRRRFGFEYNGMVLHEYYFQNLGKGTHQEPCKELRNALAKQWSSFAEWQKDFETAGKTRGIGWALLCLDPETQTLVNLFIADHEIGIIAGFKVILAMDVWEHAYMVDHTASGRKDYIAAFMKNIHWDIVNQRYMQAISSKNLIHTK